MLARVEPPTPPLQCRFHCCCWCCCFVIYVIHKNVGPKSASTLDFGVLRVCIWVRVCVRACLLCASVCVCLCVWMCCRVACIVSVGRAAALFFFSCPACHVFQLHHLCVCVWVINCGCVCMFVRVCMLIDVCLY